MLSSEDCWRKFLLCEATAEGLADPRMRADWSGLAESWRALAEDGDPRRTTARLMAGIRSA